MNIKKVVSIILVVIMLFAIIPLNISAAEKYSDISDHWARNYINTWSDYGILLGYPEGTFMPDNNITRAEMAVILNRVLEYTNRSSASTYSDVSVSDWYYDAILKLHAADIMLTKSGSVKPGERITRQEAITMIAKAFNVYDDSTRSNFTDESSVSSWALPYVRGMKANRYINGYEDGSFKPNDVLTRAEVVTILDNIIREFINNPSTYGTSSRKTTINGNVVISSQDVSLINLDVIGDVYIMPGVERGDVTITNTSISGTVYVWGGGSNTIDFKNSNASVMEINNSGTRVYSSGSTITTVNIINGIFDADDSTKTTNINMENGTVNLLNRSSATNITTKSGTVNIDTNSTVDKLNATSTAINVKSTATVNDIKINTGSNSSITVNGTVKNLNSDVTLTVSGSGTVEKSNLNNPNNVILKSITADGSYSALTTKLTLTFDKDITNLAATDIIIANSTTTINTGATRGMLTKVPNSTGVYELTVNGIVMSGNIDVTVSKSGFTINDNKKTVPVYYVVTTGVVVKSVSIDGGTTSGVSYNSSKITIKFDQDVSNLINTDFVITDSAGAASTTGVIITSISKVAGAIGIYELNLSNIVQSGNIRLSFSKTGYTFSTSATGVKNATYQHASLLNVVYSANKLIPILPTITQNGSSTAKTTKLNIKFNYDVTLSYNDITVEAISGKSETLSKTSSGLTEISKREYELTVSTSGTTTSTGESYYVIVNATPVGYTSSPQIVQVYNPSTTTITFEGVDSVEYTTGTNSGTTQYLELSFSHDLTGISMTTLNSAITITDTDNTGISKTTITKQPGTTGIYRLAVTGVNKSGRIRVDIDSSKLSGFSLSPSYISNVNVYYKDNSINATFISLTADGGSDGKSTVNTTMLTLVFDKAIDLKVDNISISPSTGITMKKFNVLGNGKYTIELDITSGSSRNINLSVLNITNHTIANPTQSVYVYYAAPGTDPGTQPGTDKIVRYLIESNGKPWRKDANDNEATSFLKITFDSNLPSDFSYNNIIFKPASSASLATKTLNSIPAPGGVSTIYQYTISNIIEDHTIDLEFNYAGYQFIPQSQSVASFMIYTGKAPIVNVVAPINQILDPNGYINGFTVTFDKPVELSKNDFKDYKTLLNGLDYEIKTVTSNLNKTQYTCMFTSSVTQEGEIRFNIDNKNYEFKYISTFASYESILVSLPNITVKNITNIVDNKGFTTGFRIEFDKSIADLDKDSIVPIITGNGLNLTIDEFTAENGSNDKIYICTFDSGGDFGNEGQFQFRIEHDTFGFKYRVANAGYETVNIAKQTISVANVSALKDSDGFTIGFRIELDDPVVLTTGSINNVYNTVLDSTGTIVTPVGATNKVYDCTFSGDSKLKALVAGELTFSISYENYKFNYSKLNSNTNQTDSSTNDYIKLNIFVPAKYTVDQGVNVGVDTTILYVTFSIDIKNVQFTINTNTNVAIDTTKSITYNANSGENKYTYSIPLKITNSGNITLNISHNVSGYEFVNGRNSSEKTSVTYSITKPTP